MHRMRDVGIDADDIAVRHVDSAVVAGYVAFALKGDDKLKIFVQIGTAVPAVTLAFPFVKNDGGIFHMGIVPFINTVLHAFSSKTQYCRIESQDVYLTSI